MQNNCKNHMPHDQPFSLSWRCFWAPRAINNLVSDRKVLYAVIEFWYACSSRKSESSSSCSGSLTLETLILWYSARILRALSHPLESKRLYLFWFPAIAEIRRLRSSWLSSFTITADSACSLFNSKPFRSKLSSKINTLSKVVRQKAWAALPSCRTCPAVIPSACKNPSIFFSTASSFCVMFRKTCLPAGPIPMHPSASTNPASQGQESSPRSWKSQDFRCVKCCTACLRWADFDGQSIRSCNWERLRIEYIWRCWAASRVDFLAQSAHCSVGFRKPLPGRILVIPPPNASLKNSKASAPQLESPTDK